MRRGGRAALVAAAVVATAAGLLTPTRTEEAGRTTYGTMPWGYRAAFELLAELGFPVERFHETPEHLPAARTAWWIAPPALCHEADADLEGATEVPGSWIRSGGTAVAFLPEGTWDVCVLDGVPLPARERVHVEKGEETSVEGLGPSRAVPLRGVGGFVDDGDWTVRARFAGRPFVIERSVGAGRLVAVADDRILRNEALAARDTAPLVVDLVRTYGPPLVVEPDRPTGGRLPPAVGYLAHSSAVALFGGLALTGLLFAWQGSLVPPRALDDGESIAPTLATFVDGVATLYAGTNDHARVLERYRAFTAGRLRRHLGLPPELPAPALVERIERWRPLPDDARRLLLEGAEVRSREELRAAVARLDTLVTEVTA